MWNALLRRSGGPANSDNQTSRRRHERRETDLCMARLNDTTYPVRDWSFGGLQIEADGRSFPLGHVFDVVLSVKASDRIWDIQHTASVIRRTGEQVALQFDPLPGHVRIQMENVLRKVQQTRFSEI